MAGLEALARDEALDDDHVMGVNSSLLFFFSVLDQTRIWGGGLLLELLSSGVDGEGELQANSWFAGARRLRLRTLQPSTTNRVSVLIQQGRVTVSPPSAQAFEVAPIIANVIACLASIPTI